MIPFRLGFALFVATAFIGAAFLFRTTSTSQTQNSLIAVDSQATLPPADFLATDFLDKNIFGTPASASKPNKELSATDAVSRQLFSDYIKLAAQGKSSSDNLNSLAAQYSEGILNSASSITVSREQIIISDDSPASLKIYSQAVFTLRSRYGGMVNAAFSQKSFTDADDPNFGSLMSYASNLYAQAASDLLKVPVPPSLSATHLKLVENYLSSAQAMEELVDITTDPVRTYAALNLYAKNTEEETGLLANIQMALLTNPTIFNDGI